jgi:hypothetical protein
MPTTPNGPTDGSAPLSDTARRALTTAGATYRASFAALRKAICAYVEDLQRESARPDDIADLVRSFVADLRASDPDASAPTWVHDALLDRLVAECLELEAGTP